jgi:hypothetical protein
MHGVIHRNLKQYVEDRMEDGAWEQVRDHAGVEPKLYLPVSHYPDEEFHALVDAIAALSGHDESTVLENFGAFLTPDLLDTFKAHVRDDWDALDLLANLETVYEQIERQNDENALPNVHSDRVVSDMVVLTYQSDRDLCPMGRGVVEALGEQYDQALTVEEEKCQRADADHCEFTVSLA